MRRVATAFFVATVGTAVFGGTAQAATLTATPTKACYVSGEQVDVNGVSPLLIDIAHQAVDRVS